MVQRQIICEALSRKNPLPKRAGGVAQVVEHLSSKCEALNQTPVLPRKEERKNFWVKCGGSTLAIPEAEIGSILIRGQPGQKVLKTLTQQIKAAC
jgi:hypothetical protein